MLVLIVDLFADDAGLLRDLLKLLEESLSLDNVRRSGVKELGEIAGLLFVPFPATGEELAGEAGILFF